MKIDKKYTEKIDFEFREVNTDLHEFFVNWMNHAKSPINMPMYNIQVINIPKKFWWLKWLPKTILRKLFGYVVYTDCTPIDFPEFESTNYQDHLNINAKFEFNSKELK